MKCFFSGNSYLILFGPRLDIEAATNSLDADSQRVHVARLGFRRSRCHVVFGVGCHQSQDRDGVNGSRPPSRSEAKDSAIAILAAS